MKARVIHIITRLELGGAQEATLFTVRNLRRDIYDVTLVAGGEDLLTPEARAIPDMEFIEVPEMVREVSPVRDARALARLARIIRDRVRRSPGGVIVHTHSSKAGILGRWAARVAGAKKVVHSVHGYGFTDYQGRFRRGAFVGLEKLAARVTDAFTADSRANIDRGMALGLFDGAEARVVRCGIPVGFFKEKPAQSDGVRLGLPEGAPVVLMVSCLKPQKAPLDFVRVAARVVEFVPDAHFVLAGDGELKGDVLAEAGRLGVSDRLRLLGWRRDVRDLFHISDVVVLTSLWEGLPKVIPQAMAAGKPLVATAVDGTPEAVRDGVNGFLARPHDVEYMAGKVAQLLNDPALARRMGEAGRWMVDEFDEGKMLRDIEALYERLLKEAV